MAFSSVADALTAGLTAGANGGSAANLNKKNREWQEKQAKVQRDWNESMYNKQNAWNLEMWNKENEYNTPAAQYARLREAGLNPMFYGLDGTGNAGSVETAQPLGYERASSNPQLNPVGEALNAFIQQKGIENATKLANAQVDKLQEESSGLKLDNEWKDKTMEARVESEALSNNVTQEQIKEIGSKIKVNEANAKKAEEEAKTEVEKRAAIMAQKMLYNAQEKEILEMLPFKKLLTEAQTQAQKASAAASFAKAAIDRKLLDAGYVEATVDSIVQSALKDKAIRLNSEQQAKLNEWKLSVRNGTYFNLEECDTVVGKIIQGAGNVLMSTFSQASEIALGGIKLQ